MDIYILCIQSSVNIHLCCFHFFLKNNAALDIHVQVFCVYTCFHFSWVYPLEWYCWVIWQFCLSLRNRQTVFLKQLCHLKFLPVRNKDSTFSTSASTFVIMSLFVYNHSCECGLVSQSGFDFYFLNDKCCWASICVLIWSFRYLLWRMIHSNSLPFKNWAFFLLLNCTSSYSGYKSLIRYIVCK